MRNRPHFRALPALVCFVLVATACTSSSDKAKPKPTPTAGEPAASPAGQDKPAAGPALEIPKERTFATVEFDVEFMDPNLIGESSGTRIASQMFEQLVTVAPGEPKPVPAQATKWVSEEDGRVYVFTLRKDAAWSDGTPLTSADWMYSFQRALTPDTGSRNAQQLWAIKGAKEFNKGDTTDFSTVGVTAPDAYTLRFELLAPAPYFLDMLSYIAFSPVPKHAIEKHGKKWTRPENIVCNGPFCMTVWKQGDRIEVEKNPKYWDADNVWLDKVVFYFSNNENAAHDWYETGKVQWTPGLVPVDKVKELLESGRGDYRIDPILCTYYYVFNMTKPPFDDVKVRRAFNMAMDKGRLVRQVLGQGQKAATHLVPPHFEASRGYKEVRGDPYDPDTARKLLAEAGYGKDGKPLPEISLIYNTSEGHRRIAEYYQRSIKAAIGVDVQINNMEWKSLLQAAHSGEFQIARTSWCADYPDPENFLAVFHSEGENNYSRYVSKEYDALIDQLRTTGDPAKRNALSAKAEAMLNTDVPMTPFYFYTRGAMLKPYVRGLAPQISDRHFFKFVWFGPPGAEKP